MKSVCIDQGGEMFPLARVQYVFAISQAAFTFLEKNDPELLNKIFGRILVFGRMTPQGKIDVVKKIQAQGYIVAMCGDGGRDARSETFLDLVEVHDTCFPMDHRISMPFMTRPKSDNHLWHPYPLARGTHGPDCADVQAFLCILEESGDAVLRR